MTFIRIVPLSLLPQPSTYIVQTGKDLHNRRNSFSHSVWYAYGRREEAAKAGMGDLRSPVAVLPPFKA